MGGVTNLPIVRDGPERIDELRPLLESLSAHDAEVAPHLAALGGLRTPAESWAVRRALYEEWLAEPDAFILIAEAASEPVGYALVHMRGPEEDVVHTGSDRRTGNADRGARSSRPGHRSRTR